jgi:phenylalanyl-tRNA synthetase beta chain
VDYLNSEFIVNYISQLIVDQCGGNCSNIISLVGNKLKYLEEVEFSPESIGKLAGFKIDSEECKKILSSLQFELSSINNKVKIPSYRQGDILGEADLIEEVLRIYGYNKIPSLPFKVPVNELKSNDNEFNEKIRGRLTTRNINEVITWSFMEKRIAQELGFVDLIKLKNPISLELEVMRPTVILNLLNLVVKNISRGFVNIGFFEIGPVYNNTYHDKQIECISGVRVGNIFDKGVHKEERQVDFFDVKADIFSVLEEVNFNPENLTVNKHSSQYYHPGRSAVFKLGNQIIAYGGEIHPALLKKLDINEPVVGFELFIGNLPVMKVKNAKNKLDLSNLQSVTRDFAFIVDQKIEAQSLQKAIRLLNKDVIEQVTIFDVYTGKGVEEGKKSIALSVKLQPKEQTFSEAQIDEVSNNIINHLTIKFEAKLR